MKSQNLWRPTVTKIFCIELPKSGTSTFHEAMLALGYRARHNPDDRITEQQIRDGDYKLKVLSRFDVLSDTPVQAYSLS